jgi:hypothetical protein
VYVLAVRLAAAFVIRVHDKLTIAIYIGSVVERNLDGRHFHRVLVRFSGQDL